MLWFVDMLAFVSLVNEGLTHHVGLVVDDFQEVRCIAYATPHRIFQH